MTLKKIKVYGRLRKFLGSSYFEAAVSSPAEAVRFLICNYPEVEKHMCEQYYKIKMNNFDVSLNFLSMRGKGDIQIIPVATGSVPAVVGIFSAGAAVVSTAVTAVTAVAGTALSVANTVAGAVVGTAATVANTAAGAVVAGAGAIAAEVGTTGILGNIATAVVTDVAIDGVTSLIAPTPDIPEVQEIPQNDVVLPDQRAQNSFGFSAITNISRDGVAVPIIYGEVFTGSVVISAGIDTVQVEGTAK